MRTLAFFTCRRAVSYLLEGYEFNGTHEQIWTMPRMDCYQIPLVRHFRSFQRDLPQVLLWQPVQSTGSGIILTDKARKGLCLNELIPLELCLSNGMESQWIQILPSLTPLGQSSEMHFRGLLRSPGRIKCPLSIAVTGSIIMHPINLLSVCFICTDPNSDLQAHFSNELFAH